MARFFYFFDFFLQMVLRVVMNNNGERICLVADVRAELVVFSDCQRRASL
jgi:hypothetical protein